jgi:hypothetical protein
MSPVNENLTMKNSPNGGANVTVLIDPQLPHDYVVDGCGDLPPGELVPVVELHLSRPQRYHLEIFPPEFRRHRELLPALPPSALAVLRHHRRMVGDLLAEGPPPQVFHPVALERLPQERVEGLARPRTRRRVRGYGEGGHVRQLLASVRALGGRVEDVRVLVVFSQSLQHGERFTEVDGHGDLGQVFAYAILHDAPQVQRVVWLVGNTSPPLSFAGGDCVEAILALLSFSGGTRRLSRYYNNLTKQKTKTTLSNHSPRNSLGQIHLFY